MEPSPNHNSTKDQLDALQHELAINHPMHAAIRRETAIKRRQIIDVNEDQRMLVIAGPCSDQLGTETSYEGELLSALSDDNVLVIHRRPVWKPRTDPTSWKGIDQTEPILAAMQLAAASQGSVPTAIELGEVEHQRYIENISFGWIGARSIGSTALSSMMIGNPGLPAGIKNDLSGDIEPALETINHVVEGRRRVGGDCAAPVWLINRGGGATTPETWEEAIRLSVDRTKHHKAAGLIIDLAHGGEQAHAPNADMSKTIEGQIAAFDHVLEMLDQAVEDRFEPAGIMLEASDVNPLAHRQTDPNMPLDVAITKIEELKDTIASLKARRRSQPTASPRLEVVN